METEKRYPYATVELTERCNLRCKHCYFFKDERGRLEDLPDPEIITRLAELQQRYGIKAMSWAGGEPLLRPDVLREGVKLFERNLIFTNGTVPIPDDLSMPLGVSIDGPKEINDAIRGEGVFDEVMSNIRGKPNIYFQYVLSKQNYPVLEESLEVLTKTSANGMVISIYIPIINDDTGLAFENDERDQVIEKILELKNRYPGFIFNSDESLKLMRSETAKSVTDHCDMLDNCLSMDAHLNKINPCCYGTDVDCDRCGAPTPFNRAEARRRGAKGLPPLNRLL